MKRAASIAFILLLLTASYRDAIVYLHFKINQQYIEENLCINRLESITVCGGSCFLKLQLEENHSEDDTLPNSVAGSKQIFPIYFLASPRIILFDDSLFTVFRWNGDNTYKKDHSTFLFRPPRS